MNKVEQHINYVNGHKNNLKKAWDALKTHINCDDITWFKIKQNIEEHDRSKFSQQELHQYANWFYSGENESRDEDEFKKAWVHHIHNNPHHWEHWANKESDMPFEYIIEMVLDWQSVAYDVGNTIVIFYNKERPDMILDNYTKGVLDENIEKWSQIMEKVRTN